MSKRMTKLAEPSMRLNFVIAVLFTLAAFAVGEPVLGAAEAVAVVALYFYFRAALKKRSEAIRRYIDDVADDVTSAEHGSMLSAPIAMMVFRPDTREILWSNDSFRALTGVKEDVFGNRLEDALPAFAFQWLLENRSEAPETVAVNGRRFHVYGKLDRHGGARRSTMLATTYWLDVTEAEALREASEKGRPIVGVIMLDNYDELMKAGTEASRSALLARIDEKLNAWLDGAESLFCRLDRNQYLFVTTKEKYDALSREKFNVLDAVREVVTEDGVAATLSIGVGRDAPDFGTLYKYATLSIEMALSRGGDQVVVRNQLDFEFYGGKTQASEKRTKVKSRVMANALGELISDASQVFVMGHKHADMDAVGAAAGVVCIARKRGKKAHIVIDLDDNPSGSVLARLKALPEYEDTFMSGNEAFIQARSGALLVVVDTNRPDFVESEPLLDACNRVAVIDHHRRAASYIENAALNFHEPYASSASELVTELLQYLVEPKDILRAEAEALLAGMVLDTKNFTRRTGGRTFDAAAYLRRAGADTADVQRLFQGDLKDMIERYTIIRHAEMYREDIAIAAVEEEVDRVTAAQATDELLTLQGVRASFVLYRQGGGVNLSARSLGELNVQLVMEKLGGGGNSTTAGAQIPDGTVDAVREQLMRAIDEYLEE
ncbi:MAG: DHH family phosphoesterase [Oscillospiraceae bacterium]|nr:DHH family phosphoesterase [Oscillospiraceae bacterium]